ncbi:MAG: S1C family serine protease [bacterium]
MAALPFLALTLSIRAQNQPVDLSEVYQQTHKGAVTVIAKFAPGTDTTQLGEETANFLQLLREFTNSAPAQNFQPIRMIEFWENYYERFNAVHNKIIDTLTRHGGDGIYRSMGIVVGRDGLVLSNNASALCSSKVLSIEVSDANQTVYSATWTAVDPFTNIALLRAYGAHFEDIVSITPAQEPPSPGTPIFSVQHCYWPNQTTPVPGHMGNSCYNGYGYQLNLERARHEEYFQAIMPVYQENEGAPVFDMEGRLLGLLAFEFPGGRYPGVAFAVPAWMIADIGTDLIEYGQRDRGSLGITFYEENPPLTVMDVDEGEAAARAGIQPGDVLLTFNGTPVNTFWQLQFQVFRTRPNESVIIGARRNNQPHQFLVHMDTLQINLHN